jgi:hypothetical protein
MVSDAGESLMPIDYQVDRERRLVLAKGSGRVNGREVFAYQREAWAGAEVAGFNELIDMTEVESIEVPSLESVRELAALSATMDAPGIKSKCAIVAPGSLAHALSRLYEACRAMESMSTKEIAVFRSKAEALEWLGIDLGKPSSGPVS